jgi:hypothetical protein
MKRAFKPHAESEPPRAPLPDQDVADDGQGQVFATANEASSETGNGVSLAATGQG